MSLFEIDNTAITKLNKTSFGNAGILERDDLQRLLRDQIGVVAENVLVISEEFGEWTDSRRRIDLLGIDKDANLVVIELKRSEDGGHMELQAIRYASMVANLTASRSIEIFNKYLAQRGREEDAEHLILEFLEWDELDEEKFGQDVRLVLVSADFSRELTTAVLWLNDKELDIRCVRIQPYEYDGRTLIDVQQVIPLAETAEYQVQVREKKRQERQSRKSNADFTRFDVTINGEIHKSQWKRNALLLVVKALYTEGVEITTLQDLFRTMGRGNAFLVIDGETEDVDEFRSRATESLSRVGKTYSDSRWHTAPGDLMTYQGKTYALSNQWGSHWSEFMDCLSKTSPSVVFSYTPTDSE